MISTFTCLTQRVILLSPGIQPDRSTKNEHGQGGVNNGLPTVESHLKLLTEKLDLTGDQQTKVKPFCKSYMTPRRRSCRTKVCRAKSAWGK
jgi:hypothetical protein